MFDIYLIHFQLIQFHSWIVLSADSEYFKDQCQHISSNLL